MTIPSESSPAVKIHSFRFDWLTWLLMAILGLAVITAFHQVPRNSFVDLDDADYVLANPQTLSGLNLHSIAWAWRRWHSGYYIPITWMSLQLDASLGEPVEPPAPGHPGPLPDATIYHLHNLILFIFAASMLFLILYRATKSRWPSFLAALLWAVHPLRTESVAWVTEQKDMLATSFGLLAIYFYLVWRDRPQRRWYFALCASMALSLLSKGTFVTLPFLLLLLDYWPLQRLQSLSDLRRLTLEKWPLFALTVLGSALLFLTQRSLGTAHVDGQWDNSIVSYGRYLWKQFDFSSLAVFYPRTPVLLWMAGLSAAVLLVITALALWQRRRRPALLMGWLWYLGSLVPMIGIVQAGDQSHADRFTLLPSIGLAIMLFFSIPAQWYQQAARLLVIIVLAALATVTLEAFTIRQVAYWQNTFTLFNHTRDVTPPNPLPHIALAAGYIHAGDYDNAAAEYQIAIALHPNSAAELLGLATAYLFEDQTARALPILKNVVDLDPNNAEAHNTYGAALHKDHQWDAAAEQFLIVLRLNPNDDRAQRNLQLARQHAP